MAKKMKMKQSFLLLKKEEPPSYSMILYRGCVST
jgi:hypothetical protein